MGMKCQWLHFLSLSISWQKASLLPHHLTFPQTVYGQCAQTAHFIDEEGIKSGVEMSKHLSALIGIRTPTTGLTVQQLTCRLLRNPISKQISSLITSAICNCYKCIYYMINTNVPHSGFAQQKAKFNICTNSRIFVYAIKSFKNWMDTVTVIIFNTSFCLVLLSITDSAVFTKASNEIRKRGRTHSDNRRARDIVECR